MNLIDFHSHVLPGVDDGAADLDVTKELLLSEKEQGVSLVVATPHVYREASIADFLMVRENALSMVRENLGSFVPEVIAGAEVELYCGLSQTEDVRKLCIGETNYMLIEMPFSYWNDWYYDELDALMRMGIIPIIAHLDRYLASVDDLRNIEKLLGKNLIIQINAESMLYFSFRRIFKELYKRGVSLILGSDCHDPKRRPSHMAKAAKIIKRRYGVAYLDSMMDMAAMILNR